MKKTVKNSITIPTQVQAELARRHGPRKNALSGQISQDLMFYHALLDLLALEAMIEGSFSEAEILLLLASTSALVVEPGKLAGIAPRMAAALAEHTGQDTLLSHKIMKLSISRSLWLWDRLTVYRANSHRHQDREYLLALFGVR